MNERIRELAEQAGIEFTYDPTETPMRAFVECWEDEMAKFAELIVRECAQIAKEVDGDEGDDYKSGRTWAGIDVLKHFGVES